MDPPVDPRRAPATPLLRSPPSPRALSWRSCNPGEAMEEDMDDFGDIYADVEGCVTRGVTMIPSIRQLYIEDQAKSGSSPGVGDGDSGGEEEERLLYDRIGRGGLLSDGGPASPPPAAAAAPSGGSDGKPIEALGEGGKDDVWEGSNDSDSDDDLRIVLNEEDCNRFWPSPRAGMGNGGTGACADEAEEDESVVGTGLQHSTNKDHKWADVSQSPASGLEQNGQERCGSLKSGLGLPYSQFKYVRCQSAGYPSNAKSIGQGFIIPFSSLMALRGDCDVGASVAASSCHIGFPTVLQSGFDFHIPRNRSIFDINIESFDRKPWKNQGVDITDFFNFGLNEETWKQYCENMVLFRKQANWMTRNASCGSIRQNQVFDLEFLHGVVSAEASPSEIAHFEQGGTVTSVVEKPKGKAIQVEGGSHERLPSVDIRRPRYQDSDVVIQIPVEGFDKDAAILSKKKIEHSNNFLSHSCNGVNVRHSKNSGVSNLAPPKHDGQKNGEVANCDKKDHLEAKSTMLRGANGELQNLSGPEGINNEKPRQMDVQCLGAVTTCLDEVLHSSSPSYTESISEASRDGVSVDKLQSPAKKSSFGSRSDISDGSSSNTSHTEEVNDKSSSRDTSPFVEEQACRSERELCSAVVEGDNGSTDLQKNHRNRSNSLRRYHGKLERSLSFSHHRREHPSSLEQAGMSKSCKSLRSSGNQRRMSSCTEQSPRSALDPSRNGSCHRRHNYLRREDSRHNDVKQMVCNIPKGDQSGWGEEFVTHKGRCAHSSADRAPFCTEDWSARRSKTMDDHWRCLKTDVIVEDRYMKPYIGEHDSEQFPYFDRKVVAQDEFYRDVSHRVRDKRSSLRRRERYQQELCTAMDDRQGFVEDDGELWVFPYHRSFDDQTRRGSHSVNGMISHESSSLRSQPHSLQRSSEIFVSHCRVSRAREAQFNDQRDWDLPDPCTADSYFSPYRDHHELGSGCCGIEDWDDHPQNTPFSEEGRRGRVSKLRCMAGDQVRLRHEILRHEILRHKILNDSDFPEACFSCERSYRDENSCDNHKALTSLKILHSHSLVNENGMKGPRKTGSKAKEQNYVRHREIVSGRINDYEGKFVGRHSEVAYKNKKIRDVKLEGFDHMVEIQWNKENPGRRPKTGNTTQVICSTVGKVKLCNSENYADEPEEPAVVHDQDVSGLEEGQLVETEDEDAGAVTQKWDTTKPVPFPSSELRHAYDEKKKQVEDISNTSKSSEYDNSRILETLAKMEKRRERFKEPVFPQKEQANAVNTHSEIMLVTDDVKLERPARKRRWGVVRDPSS